MECEYKNDDPSCTSDHEGNTGSFPDAVDVVTKCWIGSRKLDWRFTPVGIKRLEFGTHCILI